MRSIQSVFPLAQRTSAVDAVTLDVDADPRISCFAKYHSQHKIDADIMHMNSPGAVACALSHIGMWQKCVSLGRPIVVVEDDMFLNEHKANQIRAAVSRIPADSAFASLLYLPFMSNSKYCKTDWCPIKHDFGGLQMYYVTPTGAEILLREALPVITHVDVYVGFMAETHPEMNAVRWSDHIYTQYNAMVDDMSSTLGHKIPIRKALPHSNTFYVVFVGLFVGVLAWAITSTVKLTSRR
tara:strand:+ start:254 stop:970 length:717 start_codon:yes stop_codon:yes gene_type:complete